MPFRPPSWVPQLPFDPPDSISIAEFMLEEHYGRHPLGYSRPMFTCGLTGKAYSALEVKERVDYLARGLAKELGWQPNKGSEWDKVIGVFSVNTVRKRGCSGSMVLTSTAGYHSARLGYASSRRHTDPRECGLQRRRARVPAEELACSLSVHLRPAAGDGKGSGQEVRNTRKSYIHLGSAKRVCRPGYAQWHEDG
jgi:hypothetical protein